MAHAQDAIAFEADGAQYLTHADATGYSDGGVMFFHCRFRLETLGITQYFLRIVSSGLKVGITINTDNQIAILGRSSAGTDIWNLHTDEAIADNDWHELDIMFDSTVGMGTTRRHIYLDDTLCNLTVTTWTVGTSIDFTGTNYYIGWNGASTYFDGDIASYVFHLGTYLDTTNATNRLKLTTAGGAPAELGDNGELIFGSSPLVYLAPDPDSLGNNLGTTADWTLSNDGSPVGPTVVAGPGADDEDPTVSITSPTSAATYITNGSTIDLSGDAADNVEVYLVTWANAATGQSGNCTGTTSWSKTGIALNAGENVITITAYDLAENSATDVITVTRDNTNPTCIITTPTSDPTYEQQAETLDIAGTASDNVAVNGVAWENDRGGSGSCTGTTSWSKTGIPLFEGVNVITITVTDTAGNTGTDTLTVTTVPVWQSPIVRPGLRNHIVKPYVRPGVQ